jgi:hypothetical protein
VLIYGPGGTASQPFFPAGTIVTVASDAMWRSFTTANFRDYDILWADAGNCGPASSILSTLVATQATWGPAVTGRVNLNTADPSLHAPSSAGAARYISNSVSWLAGLGRTAAGGRTGMFISWQCSLSGSTVGAPVEFQPTFGTPFTHASGGADATAITAAGTVHPILTGITLSSGASNLQWGSYSHGTFTATPAGFVTLVLSESARPSTIVRESITCVP